ncbi:MAG: hypothetical protein JXA25_01605 [Anaerolineales bacterium]|nr:hypothetical protein [Anaerolineales bacterium]
MAIRYQVEQQENYLLLKTRGSEKSRAEASACKTAMIRTAGQYLVTNLLCDERELDSRLSDFDTFELASAVWEFAPRVDRVAVVCREEFVSDTTRYQSLIAAGGLQMKVTSDMEDAKYWLGVDG